MSDDNAKKLTEALQQAAEKIGGHLQGITEALLQLQEVSAWIAFQEHNRELSLDDGR